MCGLPAPGAQAQVGRRDELRGEGRASRMFLPGSWFSSSKSEWLAPVVSLSAPRLVVPQPSEGSARPLPRVERRLRPSY